MQTAHDELSAFHTRQFSESLEKGLQNNRHNLSLEDEEVLRRSLYTILLRQPNKQQNASSPLPEDDKDPLIDPSTQAPSTSLHTNPYPQDFDEESSVGYASTITSIILDYYATKPAPLKQDQKKKPRAKQNSLNQGSSSHPLTPDNPLFIRNLFDVLEAVQRDPEHIDTHVKTELYRLLDILFEYYEQNPDWQTNFDSFEKNQAEIIKSIANANQARNQVKADQESDLVFKVRLLRAALFLVSAGFYSFGSHDTQDEAAKNTFSSWSSDITTAIAYTATAGLAAFAGSSGPRFLIKYFTDIYAACFRKKTSPSSSSTPAPSPELIAASEQPNISGKDVAGNSVALLFALFGAGSTIAMQVKNMEEKTGTINFYQIAAIVYSALLTNSGSLIEVPKTFTKVIPGLFDVYKKAIPNIAHLFKKELSLLDDKGLEEINAKLSQKFDTFWSDKDTTPTERKEFTELKACLITSLGAKNLDAPGEENKLTHARLDEITFLLYQLQRIMNVLMLSLSNGQDLKDKLEEATEAQTRRRTVTEGALASCFAVFAAVGAIPYWAVQGEAQTIFSKWLSSQTAGLVASYVACGFSTINNVAVNVKSGFAVGKEFTVNLIDNLKETFASTDNIAGKAALLPTTTMAVLVAMIYRYVTKDNHPDYAELIDDAAGVSNGMNVCTSKPFFNEVMSTAGKGLSWCGSKIKSGFLYLKNGCKAPKSQETVPQREARERQEHRQALQQDISKKLSNLLDQISGVADELTTKTTAEMLRQMGANASTVPEFTGVVIDSDSAPTKPIPTIKKRVIPTSSSGTLHEETAPLLMGDTSKSYHTGMTPNNESSPELQALLRARARTRAGDDEHPSPTTYYSVDSSRTPTRATPPTPTVVTATRSPAYT